MYSDANHGLGGDDGSAGILFGWRFTPTLIAVLYMQMTVILFQDMKRTEPFVRLAKASPDGTSAFGTVLQSPKAWWSILADVVLRRKRTGKTSSSLICAALVNVIALLAISPLSSALLTSEEIAIMRTTRFTRLIPRSNATIPTVATRETYFRTISALMRNVSTSAWATDDSFTFPFWPSSEAIQLGPRLFSKFGTWNAESTTVRSQYQCQEMDLESAAMNNKNYSQVYSVQQQGPYNGTQPMVTFVLKSGDGCRYELSLHPAADLAFKGGITWSNATTFYPGPDVLPIGGRAIASNITSTHVYARLNASDACQGRDILIVSTPWTAPLNRTQSNGLFLPDNQTYVRSSAFRMRGLLCESRYEYSKRSSSVTLSPESDTHVQVNDDTPDDRHTALNNRIDVLGFEKLSMQDDWKAYFDHTSMIIDAKRAAGAGTEATTSGIFPEFTGMGPVLATLSNYNVTAMLDDDGLGRKAARIKGRFFAETLRDAISSSELVQAEDSEGHTTQVTERVLVLTEIGFTLAALFFTSSILLLVVYFSSRLPRRPLNLTSDPASIVGLSLLQKPETARTSTFRKMYCKTRSETYSALRRENYLTANESLIKGTTEFALVSPGVKMKNDWRPRVIQIRMLLGLCLLLAAIMSVILVLNAFSIQSRLSQTAFVYEVDISKLGASFSTFAPISIAPTITSITIGLWWDQLDSTFRVLQPYISMARGPTPIYAGAGLTYRSKSWVGAAIKAARFKHWTLLMITLGTILAQVLTVSMSALFERKATSVAQNVTLYPNLEIRETPLVSEVHIDEGERPYIAPMTILNELYLDASKNWLYSAGIQDSFNGSQLPWTSDGWSFLPLDLSDLPRFKDIAVPKKQSGQDTAAPSANLSLSLPAIRARLACAPIAELGNVSSWFEPVDKIYTGGLLPQDAEYFEKTANNTWYTLPRNIFEGTEAQTSMLSTPNQIACCANGSLDDPQQAVMGYWSPVMPRRWQSEDGDPLDSFPHQDMPWPLSITPKWVVGNPVVAHHTDGTSDVFFEETPKLQAAQCQVIIESAPATVLMDARSRVVYSHSITGSAVPVDAAWTDVFQGRANVSNTYSGPLNVKTSFGVLFLDSLLGAADRREVVTSSTERVDDNAFVFRDKEHGMNMDLMTNSMYTMANKDPHALLNYTTLVTYADRTIQTFFQHFINSGLSLKDGGYAYQPIEPQSQVTHATKRSIGDSQTKGNRGIEASVSHRVQVLSMNTTATYLSAAILAWLIGTTLLIMGVQRKYVGSVVRDVHLIADMLVLVAGSDNFLEMVEQEGVALKKSRDVNTMLGWFRDRDGNVRWGIEVVGGRDAVDWVDAPKEGWHVREKGRVAKWLPLHSRKDSMVEGD
ncbi:hypothetical protein T440DRAFT_479216 [Plenodomus tracheiphilus IPT5]|uniref:Uncharacterized protein n=1 Tax=Plenodomus tracheiphilus IPT5 TaxID=1408161 RepID=A0A6A7B5K5_9PLEO|nr:hypothetical protein T440DRAFT_479216 [Plenodomus tracheiphilus IPT5]